MAENSRETVHMVLQPPFWGSTELENNDYQDSTFDLTEGVVGKTLAEIQFNSSLQNQNF